MGGGGGGGGGGVGGLKRGDEKWFRGEVSTTSGGIIVSPLNHVEEAPPVGFNLPSSGTTNRVRRVRSGNSNGHANTNIDKVNNAINATLLAKPDPSTFGKPGRGGKPKVLLFVVVRSKYSNTALRDAVRRTWLSVNDTGLAYRFFVDKHSTCEEEAALHGKHFDNYVKILFNEGWV